MLSRKLALTLLAMALCETALAFRCGPRLVRDGLSQQEVIELCGEPAEINDLGLRLVPYVGQRDPDAGLVERDALGGRFQEEVRVTELIYDLGPRKLKRRLIFYDKTLVRIETLGYGDRE